MRTGDFVTDADGNLMLWQQFPQIHDVVTDKMRDVTQDDVDYLVARSDRLMQMENEAAEPYEHESFGLAKLPSLDDDSWKSITRNSLIEGGFIKVQLIQPNDMFGIEVPGSENAV